jgi:hypothetical protein
MPQVSSAMQRGISFEKPQACVYLFSKQPSHSPKHTVFLWIIWMVLAGYLQNGGEGFLILVDGISNLFRNVLVYENNSDIFAFFRESVEGLLNLGLFGLCVDY